MRKNQRKIFKRGVAMAMAALMVVCNGVVENGSMVHVHASEASQDERQQYAQEVINDINYMYEHNAYVKVKINSNDTDEDAKKIFLNKDGTVYEEYNRAVNVFYGGTNKIRMTDYLITDIDINTIDYIKKMAEFIGTGKGTIEKKEEGDVYKYTMKIKTTDNILDFYTYMIDEKYCKDVWAGTIINRDDAKVFDNQNYIQIQFNWSKDGNLTANCKEDINDWESHRWYIEEFRELDDWDSGDDWNQIDTTSTDEVVENIIKLQKSLSQSFAPVAKEIKKDKDKNILYTDSRNIQYNLLDDGTCTIWNVKNVSGNLDIPSKVTYKKETYKVIGISYHAFVECKDLTGITIPSSVQYIGEEAFLGCTNLEKVEIAYGVKKIDTKAFSGCEKLKELEIPDTVKTLGDDICAADCCIHCLKDTEAENYAKENELKYEFVSLPESGAILEDTKNTCKVKVIKAYGNGSTVSYAGTTNTAATNITIPTAVYINGITYKVVGIADQAFSGNKKVKKVILDKNITSIGKNAFENCSNLNSIEIKANSLKVGANAIKGTNKKLIIKVPNGKAFSFKTIFKGKGNSSVLINSTGKALPKKNLQQLGVLFDLKKNKPVSIKVKCSGIGVRKISVKVNSIKISKASKKGYKKAVIKFGISENYSKKEVHKIISSGMESFQYGGERQFAVVDKKSGQSLGKGNDFGVTVKYKTQRKKFKDNDGCWFSPEGYKSTITITYPSSYKDMCFGIGGQDKYLVSLPFNCTEYNDVFVNCSEYKRSKKNWHFMNIK